MNWWVKLEERLKGDYMANYMTFFPVGNRDMTLIQTKTNKYIMIDCNIRNAENDGDNPPSYRAKNVYIKHLKKQDRFKCTAEYPNADDPKPLTFKITGQGFSIKSIATATSQYNSFTQKSYGGE